MTSAVVVLSTAGSQEEAERIAHALVGERLAACVNLVPSVTSIYRWQGAVERATEVLLVIKTRRSLSARLVTRLKALHSYDVPEAIVLPIDGGSRPYLAWLLGETTARVRQRAGGSSRTAEMQGARQRTRSAAEGGVQRATPHPLRGHGK